MFKRFLRRFPVSTRSVRRPLRFGFVELEDRTVPATFTVTNTLDTGAGSLRNQVAAANAAAGADTIAFDPTVFTSAKTITLTTGEVAITSDLTVTGPTSSLTISGNSSSRIFNVNGAGTLVVAFEKLTLTKGVTAGVNDGGAVFIQDENVTFTNCTLTGNSSASDGGAVQIEAGGKLSLDTCTITANTAATIGGGLSIAGGPTVTITNTGFSTNNALAGGAITMVAGGSFTLVGSTLNSNTASNGDGGAIFLNGTFTTQTIRNSTIHSNLASSDGAGLALGTAHAGTVSVQNCTISSNNATGGNGGGIARTGGTALLSLVSTIVNGNAASTTADNLFTTGSVNATLCLITSTTGVTTFNGDTFTDANIGVSPLLNALANNGGPTLTRSLQASSPAIDAGSNPGAVATDQRGSGFFRVRGKAADIGAFEVPQEFIVTTTTNSGAGSLRQAVLDANAAVGIDTITFDPTVFTSAKTITLTTGELLVTEGVTIVGPAQPLTVSGNAASRVFHIENSTGGSANTTLSDMSLVNGKSSLDGGAVLIVDELVTFTRMNVSTSTATGIGGGIAVRGSTGSLTFDGGSISSNSAAHGGGIASDDSGDLVLRNATIAMNSATNTGGGIAIFEANSFSANNLTISSNTAATGGGIAWNVAGNNNSIFNSTLTGNTATGGKGGGVYVVAGTTNFTSSIVSGNSGGSGPDVFSPGTTNVNFSAVGSTVGFTLSGGNNLAVGSNLLLSPLQNNGGTHLTHAPGVNSPVLGKGSNSLGLSFDQRGTGFPRQRGGSVDIGAVEVDQFVVTNTNASGAGSLLQATLDANAAVGADRITFDEAVFTSTKTIIPAATLELTDSTDILGPATKVTISGNLTNRILFVSGGADFALSNLNLVFGSTTSVGGAVLVNGIGSVQTLVFTDCSLSFNTASDNGGAVYIAGSDSLTFIGCTLSNNRSTGVGKNGGAVHMNANGSLVFQQSMLSNNTAAADGGAISAPTTTSTVRVFDSTISGNSAGGRGGGVFSSGTINTGNVLFRNSTLSNNTAASFGGGFAWNSSSGTVVVQNSTITNNTSNTAAGGGGISVETGTGNLSIESSIVSGNVNAGAPDIDNPNTTSVKTSAIGDNLGFAKTDLGGNLPFQPHANLKLGVLASNGGPTFTHVPLAGSPLINTGSNPVSLSTDQRGFPRSLSGGVDMGSAEFLSTVVTNTNDSGAGSLRQIILDTNASPGSQTITFDSAVFATAKTITLTTGHLAITDSVVITGPTAGVTLSGNKASRVMNIGSTSSLIVSLANLTIRDGVAGIGELTGAGILVSDDTITLTNCTFTDNSALSGAGGIGVSATGLSSASLTINNSSFLNNHGHGVSIIANTIDLSVNGSTFSGNVTSDRGGAIFAANTGTVTISNSTISGNTADEGGGIFLLHGATLTIRNSTIANNTATTAGGAIGRNSAVATTITSSIIAGNTAPVGPQISAVTISATTSLIASTSGISTFSGDTFTTANIGVEPLLGPLADNGGPTLTHRPATNSPARGNGSNPASLATDQRGFARTSGTAIDIGAVEMQEFIVTNTNNAGIGSLRQAILNANAATSAEAIVSFDAAVPSGGTITLSTGEMAITRSMAILGPSPIFTISGNNTSRIFNIDGSGTLAVEISNLTLTKGKATGSNEGGAIFVQDEAVTLEGVRFTSNSASAGGGGIHLEGAGTLTMRAVEFYSNGSSAAGGGAIDSDAGGVIVIDTAAINTNTALNGAAINLTGGGSLTIVNTSLLANTGSGGNGGAIALNAAGTLTIRNSTMSGNSSSGNGGAISNAAGSSGAILIQNSTIAENTAAGSGGGISRSSTSAPLTIESTIVSGNSAASNPDINGGSATVNFSAIGNASGFTLAGANNLPFGTDLKLGTLTINGPLAFGTYLPAVDSPVVGKGSNPANLAIDQNTFNRAFGGGVDIGSAESRSIVVSTTNDTGLGSLRQGILDANARTGPDTLTFDPAVFATAKTITLAAGELLIADALTVVGPAIGVTIVAGPTSRSFTVDAPNTIANVAMSNLTITGGQAFSGNGGAILLANETLTLTDVTLIGNTAINGGAIASSFGSAGSLNLIRCTISNNQTTFTGTGFGGGIAFTHPGYDVSIDSSTLANNNAFVLGGGLYVLSPDTFSITNSTIANNSISTFSDGDGGGMLINLDGKAAALSIRNSTIVGNSASDDGGGITVYGGSNATLTIQNSTITNNTAGGFGGGIAATSANTVVESSVVSGNTAFTGLDFFADTITAKTSLVGSKAGVNTFSGDAFTNANIGVNPQLGALANNGGPTQTMLPAISSPAFNTGSNPAGLSTDQRGFARGIGTTDIGAVELQTFVVTTTSNSGAGSLRQAVLDANAAAGPQTILFDAIVFATAKTITLSTGQLLLTDAITIQGPTSRVTINGNAASRVFAIDIATATDFMFSNLIITNGRTTGSTDEDGAGIRGDNGARITLTNCDLLNNTGAGSFSNGGGLANFGGSCVTTLIDCLVQGNSASGNGGGVGGNELSTLRTTFVNNLSGSRGGGAFGNISMTLTDTAIFNNSATSSAGGVHINGQGVFRIRNSTISGNTSNFGGGLGLGGSTTAGFEGTLEIDNSTITANTATTQGGGMTQIFGTGFSGTVAFESAILAGNSAPNHPDLVADFVTAQQSLIGSKSGVFVFTGDTFTTTNIGVNPLLGALANNGGPTKSHLPSFNSPAVNNGSNPVALTTDQRGFARVLGGTIDIGAVEVFDSVVRNTNDAGAGSLRQVILDANAVTGANAITFDPTVFATTKTITLTSGQLTLTESASISGPSVGVTIDGNTASRILELHTPAGGGTFTLANLTLQGGSTFGTFGSGLLLSSADTVSLNALVVRNNIGSTGGAGIAVTAPADLSIRDSSLLANTAASGGSGGGGLFMNNGGKLLIERSTIANNISLAVSGGGGLRLNGLFTTGAIVRNSTISGNSAPGSIPFNQGSGGGIHLGGFNGTFTLQNSTVVNNQAKDSGGAILGNNSASIDIVSSILSGNSAPTGSQIATTGSVTAATSLIASKSGVTSFSPDSFTLANLGVNPQLGPLQNNGGSTLTHLPAASSRAVNTGSNPATLLADQRGFSRVLGGAIDIGAVETRSFLVTNTNDSGAGSLRQAIFDTNSVAGADIIAFDRTVFGTSAKTISALTAYPDITDAISIEGAPLLTVRRDPGAATAFRVFNLRPSALNGSMSDFTISGGSGGIITEGVALTLDRMVISGNSVSGSGGGVFAHSGSTLLVRDTTISQNSSGVNGGGIAVSQSAATIERSTFSNNTAVRGGGLFLNLTTAAAIRNSTLSGNTAVTSAGLEINTVSTPVSIRNSTITANTSSSSASGLGVAVATGAIDIQSSIVAGNINNQDVVFAQPIALGNSLVGTFAGGGSFTNLGGNLPFGLNPRLAPLADNGGFTLTHLPLNTSPLINAGSNPDGPPTDQRGSARVIGSAIDIGATEFNNFSFNVNGNAAQRSRVTSLTLNFTSPLEASLFSGVGAITLTRTTGSPVVVQTGATGANGRILVSPASGAVFSLTLTFDNANGAGATNGVEFGSLSDGRWQLALPAFGFTSTLNDLYLARLFGDVNGDGTVDGGSDFAQFGFRTAAGDPFDFNNDGTIDGGTDFAQFGTRFGRSV